MGQPISSGVAIIGRYYDSEDRAIKAMSKKEAVVKQGNHFIVISETQAKKLKK